MVPHFKVGDSVRRTAGSWAGMRVGDEAVITKVDYPRVFLSPYRGDTGRSSHDSGNFVLIPELAPCAPHEDSPIQTKASNPKEAIGSTKLDLSLVPSTAVAYLATAFTEGALKYGSYNWRVAGVRASTYMSAAGRHQAKWWNGEECDPATKVKHLANAMACLAIVLDAELVGLLNDDRPPKADMAKLIDDLGGTIDT